MIYYFKNDFVEDNLNTIDIRDRGFLLGDGVFTTIKSINSRLILFSNHIKRLNENAATIKINLVLDCDKIQNICRALLIKNTLDQKEAIIRITITRGISQRGINIPPQDLQNPTLLICAMSYQDPMNESIRVCITSIVRNEKSIVSKIKSLNYLESILARDEATERGFDEGIMLNNSGFITSGSVSNVFFVDTNNQLITPKIADGVLAGITRAEVISIAKEFGIKVIERSITPAEVCSYLAGFITNSALGIKPINTIDAIKVPSSGNNVVQKILSKYNQLVNS